MSWFMPNTHILPHFIMKIAYSSRIHEVLKELNFHVKCLSNNKIIASRLCVITQTIIVCLFDKSQPK